MKVCKNKTTSLILQAGGGAGPVKLLLTGPFRHTDCAEQMVGGRLMTVALQVEHHQHTAAYMC